MERVREAVGDSIDIAVHCHNEFDTLSSVQIAKAIEPINPLFLEDPMPVSFSEGWAALRRSTRVPILAGEKLELVAGFKPFLDNQTADIIHPDLATSGGLLETKKIGDMAQSYGVPMAMHFAGTPVSFMANVHCAAATENFVALEHHSVDVPWWEDLVTGPEKPINKRGFATPPDRPGLGIELVEEVVKAHLKPGTQYFAPTPEWDNERSWDRLWS